MYADGGIPRFYRGVLPALIQGPMSRFGDTAANTGMLTLLDNMEATQNLNVGVKTVAASSAAALFRIFLMPVDTVKVRLECQTRKTRRICCTETNEGQWSFPLREFDCYSVSLWIVDLLMGHVSNKLPCRFISSLITRAESNNSWVYTPNSNVIIKSTPILSFISFQFIRIYV